MSFVNHPRISEFLGQCTLKIVQMRCLIATSSSNSGGGSSQHVASWPNVANEQVCTIAAQLSTRDCQMYSGSINAHAGRLEFHVPWCMLTGVIHRDSLQVNISVAQRPSQLQPALYTLL